MSGKPGCVRAVAPRLLVYVEPRQLEPAAPPHCRPPQPLYAPPHHAARATQLFYKPLDHDNKLALFGTHDINHKPEFYQVPQQYSKETGLKIEDSGPDRPPGIHIKQDSVDKIGGEYCGVETFQCRTATEPAELAAYQARCSGGSVDSMPVQQITFCQGQNQYSESVTVHSADISSEKESVDKSYVNYQFLEQSVSHRSIVNQSISILNQQVGVSPGVVSEGESSSQLVRTAEGVVLAVVPGPAVPALDTPHADHPPSVTSDSAQTITVPLGWRRIVTGTSVLYISPSGTALSTLPQLREYLQTAGTCKCGLPCPLRPETAFSFDSKVVSKPYQAAVGAELAKLCNHKRKLLASLQARTHSPDTPPPNNNEQKKAMGTEVAVLKKKMKKRPGFPSNMSVSQLMVQRERPLAEFKESECGRDPAGASRVPGAAPPPYPCAPAAAAAAASDADKQRSAHYITVNNGWITQHHPEHKPPPHAQPLGVPVRGANGQIIGVNTCYKQTFRPPLPDHDQKEERKDPPGPQPPKQMQNAGKEEESQIFCGLNQALTPEVMQKINEQQQIFIQQNQKQIEMAMKGYRSQLAESANQCKPRGPAPLAPQGQLIIQNGAVVKTNPAKTPPWQVKRSDGSPAVTSPNPKIQKLDLAEYEESNATMSEDSSSSFSSMSSSEQRVPPLPQHYPAALALPCAPQDNTRKKGKPTKQGKKKNSPTDNKLITFGTNGMRLLQDPRGNCSEDTAANNVPSFMDDPSGYLAQQTVLLNDTISRQVGMSSSYDGTRFDGSNGAYLRHQQQQQQRTSMKPGEMSNTYRVGALDSSPSPHATPDSSVLSDRGSDNSMLQCCRGCDVAKGDSPEYGEQMRGNYVKHGAFKLEEGRQAGGDSPAPGALERAPIQAGTVTSSARAEAVPPEPSPTPPGSSRSADTPLAHAPYPSPEPCYPAHPATGNQMMHFISNHNVNKNLMEVDNICMVGVRVGGTRGLPAYCPPPHLGARPVAQCAGAAPRGSTVAGGLSVTRDTVTCVLAGRAHTATTSVRAARAQRPPPPLDLAIPNTQPDPFLDAVNLPTSYPLHIAGTTAQNMISKSPLEMVQHVIGALPARSEQAACPPASLAAGRRTTPGQILISSTGQIIVSDERMPPPPPKASSAVAFSQNTNLASVSSPQQAAGGQGGGQPTVVVNAMPGGPFMLQQPMMAVDGQVLQQGQLVPPGHSPDDPRHMDMKGQQFTPGGAMLSPESLRRRNKKKRSPGSVAGVLQVAAGVLPSQGAQFSPRFQLSPGGNLSPTPVLQALTIVPGKQGAPAHIVMNGQGGASFSQQQLLAGAPQSQQINLLQPVNLINNGGGVVPNFPFQQFLVPGLGGVVMEGAALLPDAGVQLQLSTVNGQSVLTPVQGQVFGGGGVVLRAPPAKLQHSPTAHLFHQPHQQVLVSAASFPQQASPLLANLSPTLCAPRQPPHDLVQGRVSRALVVPVSPKRRTDTFVQNTTIVRQQTTLVSAEEPARLLLEERHSVSTQTARKSPRAGGSPPDTTTHSPLGALEEARATPRPADTTTSPEPHDNNASAMVQCVSSSEPDMSDARELGWPAARPDYHIDGEGHGTMMSNMGMMRPRPHNPVESSEIHYSQQMMPQPHTQHTLPVATNYYERTQTYKRKNDFGDGSTYRSDKIMRTNSYNMLHAPKDTDYVMGVDKNQLRHYQPSGSNSDGAALQKVFDRHHLGSSDDGGSSEGGEAKSDASGHFDGKSETSRQFEAGQVVWGPVKGYPSWPGALIGRGADGRWRVRWFGGERAPPPISFVQSRDLLTLSEGLEAHHAARTKHRKSRKLNTLLESAIQEAMAELDKKSERPSEESAEATSSEPPSAEPITETPKRTKKDKMKAKSQHKKNPVKIAPNPNKTGDGARLRSSR